MPGPVAMRYQRYLSIPFDQRLSLRLRNSML
jgi:hypothetical protein